jgi:hypothetical protein
VRADITDSKLNFLHRPVRKGQAEKYTEIQEMKSINDHEEEE